MFNSLKCAKTLEEAGVPRGQAEAHVLIISELLEMNLATKNDALALKQDFEHLRQDFGYLRQEFEHLKQDIEQKIVHSEQRMTIRLGTIVSLAIGVAVTLAKLFT